MIVLLAVCLTASVVLLSFAPSVRARLSKSRLDSRPGARRGPSACPRQDSAFASSAWMPRLGRSVVIIGLSAGAVIGAASSASAAPPEDYIGNPKASCAGILASEHAHTDGGADDLVRLFKGYAEFYGLSYGQLVRTGAQRHDGTHAICGNE